MIGRPDRQNPRPNFNPNPNHNPNPKAFREGVLLEREIAEAQLEVMEKNQS